MIFPTFSSRSLPLLALNSGATGRLSPESGGTPSSFSEDASWIGGSTDCEQNGLKLSYMKSMSSSCSWVTLHMLSVAFLAQRLASAYFLQEKQDKKMTVQLQKMTIIAAFLRLARLFSRHFLFSNVIFCTV